MRITQTVIQFFVSQCIDKCCVIFEGASYIRAHIGYQVVQIYAVGDHFDDISGVFNCFNDRTGGRILRFRRVPTMLKNELLGASSSNAFSDGSAQIPAELKVRKK